MLLIIIGSLAISFLIAIPIFVGILIWIRNYPETLKVKIGVASLPSLVSVVIANVLFALLCIDLSIRQWFYSVGNSIKNSVWPILIFVWPYIVWIGFGSLMGSLLGNLRSVIGKLPSGYVYIPFRESTSLENIWHHKGTIHKVRNIFKVISPILFLTAILVSVRVTNWNMKVVFLISLLISFIFFFIASPEGTELLWNIKKFRNRN